MGKGLGGYRCLVWDLPLELRVIFKNLAGQVYIPSFVIYEHLVGVSSIWGTGVPFHLHVLFSIPLGVLEYFFLLPCEHSTLLPQRLSCL